MQKQSGKRTMNLPKHLQRLNLHAAGIDIGSKSHFVAVPAGTDEETVREFECFTADLYRLADWLISCGVTTVAMESTGTYWIPVFEILESRNLEVNSTFAPVKDGLTYCNNMDISKNTSWK